MADDDPIETTLAILRECFVYKIPPRQTAGGYKAQDWNVESFLWTGRVRVVSLGDKCIIKLEDKASGDLFAQCPVTDGAVESVTDSSRYFVLKIEDGGRRAFVGMGFTERSDAFDFNAALIDHKRHVREAMEGAETMKRLEEADKKDYSLKDGQTIRVNVNIKRKDGSAAPTKPSLTGSGGGFGLLPPPPSGHSVSRGSGGLGAPAAPSPVAAKADPFGDFSDFASALPASGTAASSSTSQSSNASNLFDWSGFQ